MLTDLLFLLACVACQFLFKGIDCDSKALRDLSEQGLIALNNQFGLVKIVTHHYQQSSSSAEVRFRLRRVLKAYEDVYPSCGKGTYPRIDSLQAPIKSDLQPMTPYQHQEADALFVDFLGRNSENPWSTWQDKGVNNDTYPRYLCREYVLKLLNLGVSRVQIRKMLDKAMKSERASGIVPKRNSIVFIVANAD